MCSLMYLTTTNPLIKSNHSTLAGGIYHQNVIINVTATLKDVLIWIIINLQTTFKTNLQHVLHGWYHVFPLTTRLFPPRYRSLSLVSPNSGGKVPVNAAPRNSTRRRCFKLPSSEGSVPLRPSHPRDVSLRPPRTKE
jgi:hypothetical protein